MCNLYNLTTSREAMRRMFRVTSDRIRDLPDPTNLDIYPDRSAPVVRAEGDMRIAEQMLWGFPPPPKGNRPVTNVRNLDSPFWRTWLHKPEQRCPVPVTRFSEYEGPTGAKRKRWFAVGDDEPLFAFAGIWRPWHGERRKVEDDFLLFSFLTCPPNDVVKPIHEKAMPVLLSEPDGFETWLSAPWQIARELVRPYPTERTVLRD